MSKMSKAIAVLGVVAGLGVAALPLSSYAADEPYSQSASADVQVEVGGAISISTDATDGKVDLEEMTLNNVSTTKDLKVTVSSNSEVGYGLTIKALTANAEGNGVLTNENGDTISSSANIAGGTSAWGYRLANAEAEGGYGAWTAVTGAPEEIHAHTAAAGDAEMEDVTTVNFGASANSTQQQGTYKGTVVFTATVK
mgnify:FL=1